MISIGIYLTERGYVPEFVLRWFIRRFSLSRLVEADSDESKLLVINGLKTGPIAENTLDANDQHYELAPEFFERILGPHLKYSCLLYTSPSPRD